MKTTLVIHIRSGSVSAGLVGAPKKGLPDVVYHFKQIFKSGDSAEKAMLLALRKVLKKVFDEGVSCVREKGFPSDIDHTIISLAGRWVDEREKEFADPELIKAIEIEVGRAMGIRRGVAFHTFSHIFHQILSNLEKNLGRVLLIDFGHDAMHATMLNGVGRMPAINVPLGSHSLVEAVAKELDVDNLIAESLLSLYARGDLDDDAAARVSVVLKDTEDKWRMQWQEALSGMSADRIVIVSDKHASQLARSLAWNASSGARISVVGEDLKISSQIIKVGVHHVDEPIAIIASFSASLL